MEIVVYLFGDTDGNAWPESDTLTYKAEPVTKSIKQRVIHMSIKFNKGTCFLKQVSSS
jgi:hypothetical protein